MLPSRSNRIARLLIALGLGVTVLHPLLASPAGAHGRSLNGTWLVEVRLLTACAGGTALPPFWSMLVFARGGTVTGTTMNAAFAPGQRGPDNGIWGRGDGGRYSASSLAFINFATPAAPPVSPGFQVGSQRIDQDITLTGPDTFTSSATVTFFDAAGLAYRQGCAVASGRRFE